MAKVYERPKALADVPTHYCPGCTHGIIHKLIAEVMDELNLVDMAVGVAPVGCAVLAYDYFNCDMQEAAHGRAPAVATGIKRVSPESMVFTYQGDGDLASIGAAEIVHAAARGEDITVIFVNNGIYGMTGGQMAPTTLPGDRTSTSPFGRDVSKQGNPIRVCEMLSTLDGPAYITRTTVHNVPGVLKTKRAIKKAVEYQMAGKGFTMVEILSTCPTNWGLTPQESMQKVEKTMIPYFPLGDFKDIEAGGKK
ncbi:MAG TPA: thiamine pyrophosphate-dependent enzyme [Bacillota bacterium]|nr:thiamine pyrophosphate-dependent enzyme [Bacillota bacterium]